MIGMTQCRVLHPHVDGGHESRSSPSRAIGPRFSKRLLTWRLLLGSNENYPQVVWSRSGSGGSPAMQIPARLPHEEGCEGGGAGHSVGEGLGRQPLWFFTGHGR